MLRLIWLWALEVLAAPAKLLDDAAMVELWAVDSTILEATIGCGVLLAAAAWSMVGGLSLGLAFAALFVYRGIGLLMDILYLTCGCGFAWRVMRRAPTAILVPKLCRMLDGLACGLTTLMLVFIATGQPDMKLSRPSTLVPASSMYHTMFFPIIIATAMQAGVIAVCAIAILSGCDTACLGLDADTDALTSRRRLPRWRLVITSFGWRVIILVLNMMVFPLAAKLDDYWSVSWDAVLLPGWAILCIAAAAMVAIPISCFAEWFTPNSLLSRPKLKFAATATIALAGLSASLFATLAVARLQLADAESRMIADPKAGFYIPFWLSRGILIPWTLFICIFLASTWVLCSDSVLGDWRRHHARVWGIATPSTHLARELAEAASAAQQRRRARLGLDSFGDCPSFGPHLPPPTLLVNIGHHRYRRVSIADDLEVLEKAEHRCYRLSDPQQAVRAQHDGEQKNGGSITIITDVDAEDDGGLRQQHRWQQHGQSAASSERRGDLQNSSGTVYRRALTDGVLLAGVLQHLRHVMHPRAATAHHPEPAADSHAATAAAASATSATVRPQLQHATAHDVAAVSVELGHSRLHRHLDRADTAPFSSADPCCGSNRVGHVADASVGVPAFQRSSSTSHRLPTLAPATSRRLLNASLPRCSAPTPRMSSVSLLGSPPGASAAGNLTRPDASAVPSAAACSAACTAAATFPAHLPSSAVTPSPTSLMANGGGGCDHMCQLCCCEPADAVFLECGHGGACFACGKRLAFHASHAHRRCPWCRSSIELLVRLAPRSAHRGLLVPVSSLLDVHHRITSPNTTASAATITAGSAHSGLI